MTATPVVHDAPLASPVVGGVTRSGGFRIDGIDLLRGLVIVLMVLDHVRDFFHVTALTADPLAMDSGSPALFATRWITHLCAPTFVFLAGVSIFLQRAGGKSRPDLTRFLLTRGLWLIVLELTIVTVGFNFGWFAFMQVIWAIGASMMVMAGLIWLPGRIVLALGVLVVAGHPLLAPINPPDLGALAPLWWATMEFGLFPPGGLMAYPLVPWLGVMMLGYGLGGLFTLEPRARTRALLWLAGGALLAFAVIRGLNGYGDPRPWSVQAEPLWTALSFINVSKYPPSPDYVLVTLGVALAILPLLERVRGPVVRVLLTFGRTPLFTYLLHIYIAHGLAVLVGVLMGVPASAFANFLADPSRLKAAEWGVGLPMVYAMWALTLVLLYPLSRWFESVRRRRRDWWLGYL